MFLKYVKIFTFVIILFSFCLPVFSQNGEEIFKKPFYRVNSDLARVGVQEILNMATVNLKNTNYRLDPDFTLGSGDVLTINFWGKIEANHKLTVDSYGNILIPMVGRVSVMGLTLDETRSIIGNAVEQKYSNVKFDLSVSDVRDIRVSVLGNVNKPGIYALSPFGKIVDALVLAGGPNSNGSMSDIRLIRDENVINSFNIYPYIFNGDQSKNTRLKHGDLIYVPQIQKIVAVRGGVSYPGIYETENNMKVGDIIEMAGGMLDTKFERKIIVLRINLLNKLTEVYKEFTFSSLKGIMEKDNILIENEDTVIVSTNLDYTPYPQDLFNVVHILGELNMPGDYLIKKGDTLSSVLKRAGGLNQTAYADGAIFTRNSVKEKHKSILDELIKAQEKVLLEEEARLSSILLTNEEKILRINALKARREALNIMASRKIDGRIVVDIKAVINGEEDILLEVGDQLYIPQRPDWVIVTGAVYSSNSIVFEDNKDFNWYINIAGGTTKNADKEDIYIIRADGSAFSSKSGYRVIKRGDIIVVPEKSN